MCFNQMVKLTNICQQSFHLMQNMLKYSVKYVNKWKETFGSERAGNYDIAQFILHIATLHSNQHILLNFVVVFH